MNKYSCVCNICEKKIILRINNEEGHKLPDIINFVHCETPQTIASVLLHEE